MAGASEAIIIGSGVSGLTTGIALQQAGIPVTLYESSEQLREIGAGLGVQYAAMKALRRIGLFDAVRDRGEPLLRVEMGSWNGKTFARIPHQPLIDKLGVATHNIHRGEFLALLLDALGRDRIVLGAKCVAIDEDESGVTARFADGRTARGSILVGADGARSFVRAQVLGDGAPRDSGIVVWRAMPEFEHPATPVGLLRQAFGRRRLFATIPGTRGRVFWFAAGPAKDFGETPQDGRKRELLDAFGHWADPVRGLLEASDEAQIARTRVYDRAPAERWSTGRVTLVGDAAHPMIPTLGQGASTGIEDGVVLAKHLAKAEDLDDAGAVADALRAYETERIARTTPLVKQARTFAKLALGSNPVLPYVRNIALRLTPQASWQRRYLAQHSYDP